MTEILDKAKALETLYAKSGDATEVDFRKQGLWRKNQKKLLRD